MRRVPLLAMLAVLCGLLAAPSNAAPLGGLMLRGSKTAYVDVYVYVNTTVTLADVTLKTKGSYVGFFLAPAPANRDTVGALVMPRVGATGGDSTNTIKLGESWDLRAGKYRMFLITDGASEVFVPIEGQGFRGWVPKGKAPLSVTRADFDVAAGTPGATRRHPMTLRQRSLVVAAGQASSSSLTAVDSFGACITSSTTCSNTYAISARLPAARTWAYGARLAPPGTYAGQFSLDRFGGVDAGSHVDGALLVLTIGLQT